MMNEVDSDVLNTALKLSLEWGENFRKPIQERLLAAFPVVDRAVADECAALCDDVRSLAFNLVEKAYLKDKTPGDSASILLQQYPWIDQNNMSSLQSQGMYYAWHDNG